MRIIINEMSSRYHIMQLHEPMNIENGKQLLFCQLTAYFLNSNVNARTAILKRPAIQILAQVLAQNK